MNVCSGAHTALLEEESIKRDPAEVADGEYGSAAKESEGDDESVEAEPARLSSLLALLRGSVHRN